MEPQGIDLNEQLILNKEATFFFHMNGHAMIDAGIQAGDILIVDKSLPVSHGKIIIASLNGELLIRRYHKNGETTTLVPENQKYKSIVVTEQSTYSTWGIVTCIIRQIVQR